MVGEMPTAPANEANTGDVVSPLPHLPRATDLLFGNSTADKKLYWDRSHYDSPVSQMKAVEKSATLYVGNMAFSTRSSQVRSHFAQTGPVKAVHMGLDRFRKTPCGFCFVEYHRRDDALSAVANLSGTKLDGRVIRVELDAGFQPGRELGRGTSGGQVRDDRRGGLDPARSKRGDSVSAATLPQDYSNGSPIAEKAPQDEAYSNPRFREE